MASKDTETSKKGMKRADEYLNKSDISKPDEDGIFTVQNKSSLNKKVSETTYEAPDFSNMSAGNLILHVKYFSNL